MSKASPATLRSFNINLHGPQRSGESDPPETNAPTAGTTANTAPLSPLGGSFEQLCERLERLPRTHLELDGSFVHRGPAPPLHIDGMIYDANGQVQYVQLQGTSDHATWQELIDVLSSDKSKPPSVQLLQSGELLSLQSFERQEWKIG